MGIPGVRFDRNVRYMGIDKLFKTCRRCLNPWILGLIVLIVVGLLIFVPIIGVASLVVALPLLGCTIMCGAMAFFMRDKGKDK